MFGNNKLNETQRAPVIWQRGSVMGALSHLQIVEIGSAAAASYCARLFADFGATVQKVESPQGEPLRRTAPYTPNGQSAWFSFLNFNKSSVALDPNDESASLRLTELIGDCDALIDGRDIDAADCPAFDLAALKQNNPGLIHVEASWVRSHDAAARARLPKSGGSDRLPLEGVRVIDFSMGWAGPICTRTLADLGADVIKIEAIQYPDWWRGIDRRSDYVLEKMYEKMPRFCIMNRNKRGITLDLTRPQGLHLAKQLLADADLAVDNYSVEVLPKLGLGYEVLSKVNSRLVMMSMSAFGSGSVYRDCRAYGSTLEQGSGLPGVVGDANGPPVMSHTAFGDAVGGLNGCAAVLIVLIHARRAGKGQFIDLAQIECMMPFAAPWIVAHSIDGKEPVKYGNRHPDFVPHGCFPCAGSDNWIVVAVSSDTMWSKLARLLGRADWAADQTLRLATGRERNRGSNRGLDFNARSGRRDERVAGRRRCVGRRAITDRLVESPAIACTRIYSGDRSRLHRQASPTIHAVPRNRQTFCDSQPATDARRAQS
jgi:crotonobetainyl-CoA:carnitine CoA-transferase CaiB-like acyl-CoA transferase